MEYKLIKYVKTQIYRKRQLVIIGYDKNDFVFLTPKMIKLHTTLGIEELELLIGSSVKITFYKKDERMYGGKQCNKNNLMIKDYSFELLHPIDLLREKNQHLLLPFKKINGIFYFTKFKRENVGINTDYEGKIFLSLKFFEHQSNLNRDEQSILIGSFIYPEYFKKGDIFWDETIVEKDYILKTLNLRYSGSISEMYEHSGRPIGYYDGSEYDTTNSSKNWGYASWDDMALHTVYEGNPSFLWNTD